MAASRSFLKNAVIGLGLLGATTLNPVLRAQTAIPLTPSAVEWSNVEALAGPTILNGLGIAIPPEMLLHQQAEQFESGSQLAKAFYAKYPNDPLTAAARKLEAILAIESVQSGATQNESSALAIASAYIANTDNSATDRLDVAVAKSMLSGSIRGATLEGNAAPFAQIADNLHAEFGELPQVYSMYLGVVHAGDPKTAAAVAGKLIGMSTAPVWAKAEAQLALDRAKLIGKPVDLILTTTTNAAVDLAAPNPTRTILYVWSNDAGTSDLQTLERYEQLVPTSVRFVYLCIDARLDSAAADVALEPIPGFSCFDPSNFSGLAAKTLKVRFTPSVYVFNTDGTLAGFGDLVDLPSLLEPAGN